MSSLGTLFETPETPEQLATWATAHAQHHRDINRLLNETYGVSLPEYVLDPIPQNATGAWQAQHQMMHNVQNALLGISGQPLNNVDFGNRDTLENWIDVNAIEHREAADILGIG